MFSRSSGNCFLMVMVVTFSFGCEGGLKYVPQDAGTDAPVGGNASKGGQGGGGGGAFGPGSGGVVGRMGVGGLLGGAGGGATGAAGRGSAEPNGGAGGRSNDPAGGAQGGWNPGVGGAGEPGTGGSLASGGTAGLGGRIGAGGTSTGSFGGAAGAQGGRMGTGGEGCAQTVCGNSCVDTKGDPRNCGSCGHDCMEGTCSYGRCQPVLIGRYDRYLGQNGISVSDDYVYGKGETNLIVRAKKDGTGLSTAALPTFATAGCPGGGVEELDGRVFYQWNDGTTCRIAVCSPTDCDGTTQGISTATPSSYVQSFAADRVGSRLFWFDATSKRFMTASTKGNATPSPVALSSLDLVVARPWTGYAGGGIFFDDGTSMLRMPASGGPAARLFDSADIASPTLWPTPNRFFWSANSTIVAVAIPTASAGPQIVIAMSAKHLWADDVDLYWDSDGLNIQHCSLANCQATTALYASSPCDIVGIRGDARAIYWGGYGTCKQSGSSVTDKAQLWKVAR